MEGHCPHARRLLEPRLPRDQAAARRPARRAAPTTAARSSARPDRARAPWRSRGRRGPSTDRGPLLAALGVELDDELLTLALTHRSYAYENGGLPTNERLEFLGDSVLGVIVTERLYRDHPDLPEGQLAKLRASVVNMHALAGVAGAARPGRARALPVPGRAARS